MKTSTGTSKSARPTAFEVARHIVSQAHRERVRLRRLSRRHIHGAPKMAAPAKQPGADD